MKKDKSFIGQGWAFPPGFSSKTRTIITAEEEEDIRQSLNILLTTQLGERVMQPRYGCNLRKMVFEKTDKTMITYFLDTIETAVVYHEPRIKLIDVKVNETDQEGKIVFIINYLIRSTNTRSNLVFPHYITEAYDRY